jgi:hypothetical protein
MKKEVQKEIPEVVLESEIFMKKKTLEAQKQKELSSLTATAKKGVVIDCDKESEENIKTALLALDDGEDTMWLTVDNKPVKLTKEELKTALRDVGIKKREIVFKYRALKDELINS